MSDEAYGLADLQAELRTFRDERDWAQFHDPKSLILALVGEVGELAELFQWVPAAEAAETFRQGERQTRAAEEMSDILIYLLSLAEAIDVNLLTAAQAKLAGSRERFPVDRHQGFAPHKR